MSDIYRRGNKGLERLKDVLTVTQLFSGRERTRFTNVSHQKIQLYLSNKSCVTLGHVTTSQSLSFLTS